MNQGLQTSIPNSIGGMSEVDRLKSRINDLENELDK